MTWKDYEIEILTYFKEQFPNAEIRHNVGIMGRYSKVERQIDVLIEDYLAGNRLRIIIDGKFFSKNIDVKDVEMFIGMLNDCEANKGLLITQEGYSQAAINRAYSDPIDIELDILNFKDLYDFQGFGGVIHAGQNGVMIPAPFGWIIDATARHEVLATLYQRGMTFETAVKSNEWMYVNIWAKGDGINTLEDLLEYQLKDTIIHDPKALIEYVPTIKRKDFSTKIRRLQATGYPTVEYTGFVEFDSFFFFCVMFTPEELRKKNIRKLEAIMQSSVPIRMVSLGPP